MRKDVRVATLLIVSTAALAGCTSEPTGASGRSFLSAAIAGGVHARYDGSGAFRTLPPTIPGPRFSLHSQGRAASSDQGFAFQAARAPAPGEYRIGVPGEESYRASYWYDRDDIRKIFEAQSGTLRISRSTTQQVTGSFQLNARLVYVCALSRSLAGQLMECERAHEQADIEVTGSFEAGPLGGDSPGLLPYDG